MRTGSGPVLPYPDEEEEEQAEEAPAPDPNEQRRLAAQSSLEDFTRNVQRKKDREMADLQFVGGDGSNAPKQVVAGKKVGRNEKCPCGSGKKYKHCHGG